jgi:hypothetical protein
MHMTDAQSPAVELQRWRDSLANATRFYPSTDFHFDRVLKLVDDWFLKTQKHLELFRRGMDVTRDTVEIGVLDARDIEANANPHLDTERNGVSSFVQVSLGIAPKALGLANRAHVARLFGAHDPMVADVFENWSIHDNTAGMLMLGAGHVDQATFNSVHDVMSLTLFHEIAHGLELFPQPTREQQQELKAFEACADEGSGFLFVCALLHEQRAQGKKDIDAIIDRLADASFFLSALLYWMSPASKDYHHPWTRMRCFMRGACLALHPKDRSRWNEVAERAWNRNVEYGMAFSLFTDEQLWFWKDEAVVAADWDNFTNVSMPLMKKMRASLTRDSILTPVTEWMNEV